MAFTDEEFKRLKECLGPCGTKTSIGLFNRKENKFLRFDLDAIIARLDAGEILIEYIDRYTRHTKMPDTAKDLFEAWQKAAGK